MPRKECEMPGADNKMAVKIFRRIREAMSRGVVYDAIFVSPEDFSTLCGNNPHRYDFAEIAGVKIKPITSYE